MTEETESDEILMSNKELTMLIMKMASQIYGGLIASGQAPGKDSQEQSIKEAIELMNMAYHWDDEDNEDA